MRSAVCIFVVVILGIGTVGCHKGEQSPLAPPVRSELVGEADGGPEGPSTQTSDSEPADGGGPPEPVFGKELGFDYGLFPSAGEALIHVIDSTEPRIVGFGEFHQQAETIGTMSALQRFSNRLLPLIAGEVSDLIVETWVSTGNCGEPEKQVTREVDEVTERPEVTEDETVKLINHAVSLNIQPHVLELACDDYERLGGGEAGLDYLQILELIGERLEKKAKDVLEWRVGSKVRAKPIVAIYGGAVHNEAAPADMWRTVTYGSGLSEAVPGRYVEIDLFVPEFIENSTLVNQEPWFPLFESKASGDHVLLIKRAERSYIIIFKRGVANPAAKGR